MRSISLFLAVLATLALPLPVSAENPDVGYKKLTWDDFQGPPPTGDEDAELAEGVSSTWSTGQPTQQGGQWKVKLEDVKSRSRFDAKQSGVKAGKQSAALLEHEQYHLDIAEYWAREREKRLEAVEGVGPTPEAAEDDAAAKAEAVEAETEALEEEMQEKYDKETNHGRDLEKQAAWCDKVKKLLRPPVPNKEQGSVPSGGVQYDPGSKNVGYQGLILNGFSRNGTPLSDPVLQGAQVVVPVTRYSGDFMGSPTLYAPEHAATFQVITSGSVVAVSGRLRLLMASPSPGASYTAWIEGVSIDSALLAVSPFLQFVEQTRALGRSIVTLKLTTSVPLAQATQGWTATANLAVSGALGTSECDPAAPPILVEPAHTAAVAGGVVRFGVYAAGTGLTYQWRRNGVPIANGGRFSGVTSDTLTITGVQLGDAGAWTVVVSGPCGSATSAPANLTVGAGAMLPLAGPVGIALLLLAMGGLGAWSVRRRRILADP